MRRKLSGMLALMLAAFHAGGQMETGHFCSAQAISMAVLPEITSDKLTSEDYRKLITSSPIVLVDFYASWCGPCKAMEPMIREFSEEQKGRVEVVRIDVDENKDLMKTMAIWEIPALKIYKDGKEQWSRVGYVEKRAIMKQLRKL